MAEPHETVLVSGEEARRFSDALADVLCWFRDFKAATAAGPDIEYPPGLDDLRTLNIRLKAVRWDDDEED